DAVGQEHPVRILQIDDLFQAVLVVVVDQLQAQLTPEPQRRLGKVVRIARPVQNLVHVRVVWRVVLVAHVATRGVENLWQRIERYVPGPDIGRGTSRDCQRIATRGVRERRYRGVPDVKDVPVR